MLRIGEVVKKRAELLKLASSDKKRPKKPHQLLKKPRPSLQKSPSFKESPSLKAKLKGRPKMGPKKGPKMGPKKVMNIQMNGKMVSAKPIMMARPKRGL